MSLCDLSANNPNVFFELGWRQAFNQPVALVKDEITKRIFDTSLLRDTEYLHDLRPGQLKDSINQISATLQKTYEDHEGGVNINSLIRLLELTPAEAKPLNDSDRTPELQLVMKKIDSLTADIQKITQDVPLEYDSYSKSIAPVLTHTNVKSPNLYIPSSYFTMLSIYLKEIKNFPPSLFAWGRIREIEEYIEKIPAQSKSDDPNIMYLVGEIQSKLTEVKPQILKEK